MRIRTAVGAHAPRLQHGHALADLARQPLLQALLLVLVVGAQPAGHLLQAGRVLGLQVAPLLRALHQPHLGHLLRAPPHTRRTRTRTGRAVQLTGMARGMPTCVVCMACCGRYSVGPQCETLHSPARPPLPTSFSRSIARADCSLSTSLASVLLALRMSCEQRGARARRPRCHGHAGTIAAHAVTLACKGVGANAPWVPTLTAERWMRMTSSRCRVRVPRVHGIKPLLVPPNGPRPPGHPYSAVGD